MNKRKFLRLAAVGAVLLAFAVVPFWWRGEKKSAAPNPVAGVNKSSLPIHNKLKGMARKAASAEWFMQQRTYPLGYIPQDAEIRAVDDMRQRMIPALRAQGLSLAKSAAAQLTWEPLGPGNIGGRLRGLVIHPTNLTIVYVGSVGGGVWKSTNAGANWTSTMSDLITLNISALAMKPGDPNTLYAGTGEAYFTGDCLPGRGILKTTDGGRTWQEKLFSSSYYFVQGIGFINEKTGWIGGSSAASSGYQTTDGGETWQPAGFGSRLNRFRFLNDTLGYAAGQRAYKYTVRTTSVAERTPAVPQSFSLSQNFPNPFNPGTAIKFSLPKASHVRITVFDMNGRQIDDILNQTREAGTHTVIWDAADKEGRLLSAGVYFYKLVTADFAATRKMILLR